MASLIGYLRVSTKAQGASGLGLEAQRAAIEAFARQGGHRIAKEYVEVESGKRADRPQLAAALSHCKRSKAMLVVAKLDRLARNVRFLATVMDSGCEFAAADMPSANRFMLHVMAAVAEHEAKAISERTTVALRAAKARGIALGASRPEGRNLTAAARARGQRRAGEVAREAAKQAYEDILPLMRDWRSEGLTLDAIAAKLNEQGHCTRRNRPWSPSLVHSVLKIQRVA